MTYFRDLSPAQRARTRAVEPELYRAASRAVADGWAIWEVAEHVAAEARRHGVETWPGLVDRLTKTAWRRTTRP